jgi:hypothetical protein
MRVLLDDSPCSVKAESISAALRSVAGEADRAGRVIVDVYVDGHRCSADDLDRLDSQTGAVSELRLVSADPSVIVAEALESAETALADADALQRDAAELLQAGHSVEAFSRLTGAVSLWTSVRQAVADGCALVDLDLDSLKVGDEPASAIIGMLTDHLRQLRSSLESLDVVRLADLLLYEMPAVIGAWHELLASLHECLNLERDSRGG